MNVRKAVIPAAGWGTRFLPVTKSVPKELLPIVDRPVIQFAVEEAAAAGIKDVVLVNSFTKRAIEDYFDRSFELERLLGGKGDHGRLAQVKAISELVNLAAVRQKEQLGLGHAILVAKALVGQEPFAVFLPDDIVEGPVSAIQQLLRVHQRYGRSVLAVRRVPDAEVGRYGIIGAQTVAERTHRVTKLVEKPRLQDAPSNLAVIGRYILTPEVFGELERVKPGAIGEIQLTDGIAGLLATQEVYAYEFEGTLYDGGTPLGLLKASVQVALKRPDTAADFRQWLRELAKRELG